MGSRDAVAMADDRFELRLAQESSAIRQEIAALRAEVATRQELDSVRKEVAALRGDVGNLRGEVGTIRGEMATRKELETLRQDMAAGFARLERQMSESRVDMMKWSFLFWTGQCFVIVGFLLVFLRNR